MTKDAPKGEMHEEFNDAVEYRSDLAKKAAEIQNNDKYGRIWAQVLALRQMTDEIISDATFDMPKKPQYKN